jgi:hypothetical protein
MRSPMSDPEDLIARMSRSLEPADREPFQRAAMDVIARMPAALIGPGTVYRAVELTWRGFFRPVDSQRAGWSHGILTPNRWRTARLTSQGSPRAVRSKRLYEALATARSGD